MEPLPTVTPPQLNGPNPGLEAPVGIGEQVQARTGQEALGKDHCLERGGCQAPEAAWALTQPAELRPGALS